MIECIAFDDVLLRPGHSAIRSRRDPDTSTIVGDIDLRIPLISSPMDTVTEVEMAIRLGEMGGMGILHRFMTPESQVDMIERVFDSEVPVIPAVGVSPDEMKRFSYLIEKCADKIDMVSIDVANGHHILMKEMITYVRAVAPGIKIMAGNVATGEGYRFLAEDLGVDAVRVGIGGGCLLPDEPILTRDGYKPISEVKIGEYVYTHTGTLKKVTDFIPSDKDEEIVVINDLKTTKNHKYYVVKEEYASLVTDDNLHKYAEWIEADMVDETYLLVSWEE